jgi:hypothetical protein
MMFSTTDVLQVSNFSFDRVNDSDSSGGRIHEQDPIAREDGRTK